MHRIESPEGEGPQGPCSFPRRVQGSGSGLQTLGMRGTQGIIPSVDTFSTSPVACGPLESLLDSHASPSLKRGIASSDFQMPLSDVIWLLYGRHCPVAQPICRAGVETQV